MRKKSDFSSDWSYKSQNFRVIGLIAVIPPQNFFEWMVLKVYKL